MQWSTLTPKQRFHFKLLAGGIVAWWGLALLAQWLPPVVLKNITPSVPLGYWVLHRRQAFQRFDVVAFPVPAAVAGLVRQRQYLPPNVPLMKPLLGQPGDWVCRRGNQMTVHRITLTVAAADHHGRPLPYWTFCGRIPLGQVFVGVPGLDTSLDSRFFGLIPESSLLGAYRRVGAR